MKQESNIRVFALAGAVVTVGFWAAGPYLPQDVPPGIESAVGFILATLFAWFVPSDWLHRIPQKGSQLVLALGLGLGAVSCATVDEHNAVAAAETPEQAAFAVYGTYTVAVEYLADLANDESVPLEVVQGLADSAEVLEPSVDALLTLTLAVESARQMVKNGNPDGQEALEEALSRLTELYAELKPDVDRLLAAIGRIRQ